jgi:hypothetical protein
MIHTLGYSLLATRIVPILLSGLMVLLVGTITSAIYINSELGEDINSLFADCRLIGSIQDPLAREYGTGVWLCTGPRSSFNEFWNLRIPQITNPFQ